MSLLDSLPHRCRIQTLETVAGTGGIGGRKQVPVVQASDVHCWEQRLDEKEIMDFDKRGFTARRKVYFNEDPNVTERHEIVITSYDGGTTTIATSAQVPLKVCAEAMPDASAGMRVLFKVVCDDNPGARI